LIAAGIDLQRDGVKIAPVPGTAGAGVNFGFIAAKALQERKIDGFWANGMGAEVAVQRGTAQLYSMCVAAMDQKVVSTTLWRQSRPPSA
jgi:hypothetical protein